jgi:hypothetical protein
MAHRPYLNRIVERADAGDVRAQEFLHQTEKLSGPVGSGYWVMDPWHAPTREELRSRQEAEQSRAALRQRLSTMLQ